MKVRPFALSDLEAAARFCELARRRDPLIEPFGERLLRLAKTERARLSLWRVVEGESSELCGIAVAAERDAAALDVYAAVAPRLRRQGFGRALLAPVLELHKALRARVVEEAVPGRAFLSSLGFAEHAAELRMERRLLPSWQAPASGTSNLRVAQPADEVAIRRLMQEAWEGAPDVFAPRPEDEVFADDRTVWLAQHDGRPAGYLAARKLGRGVAIEELAVLPGARRLGIGRALVLRAVQGAAGAVLSVAEDNGAARGLYESLGFTVSARRLVYERKPL
jgi:ribosomal protein S18 acetylase RimI-like enzyme